MSEQTLPLSLIVFAFNEAINVPVVLTDILAWLESRQAPYELLFVNDGSTDGTAGVAEQVLADHPHCQVLSHARNMGIGAAIKTGVRAATLPWVSFLPCDGQIAPMEIETLVQAALAKQVAIVFSIYRDRNDGWERTLYSAGIRGLMWGLFGVKMTSDGPYLFKRDLFDPELLKPNSFFLNFEFPLRVLRDGAKHAVVQMNCLPRRAGVSKSTGWKRIYGVAKELVGLRVRLPSRGLGARLGR